jgi:hypothetical protein
MGCSTTGSEEVTMTKDVMLSVEYVKVIGGLITIISSHIQLVVGSPAPKPGAPDIRPKAFPAECTSHSLV